MLLPKLSALGWLEAPSCTATAPAPYQQTLCNISTPVHNNLLEMLGQPHREASGTRWGSLAGGLQGTHGPWGWTWIMPAPLRRRQGQWWERELCSNTWACSTGMAAAEETHCPVTCWCTHTDATALPSWPCSCHLTSTWKTSSSDAWSSKGALQ